jgi:site-specific recombinase XerC
LAQITHQQDAHSYSALLQEGAKRRLTTTYVAFEQQYLLKSETEVRYFQELLGRNSSKATEIYTNMKWQLERICSENYYLRQPRKRFFTIKT